MGRAPCCEKVGLRRGRWTAEEDEILTNYIKANGEGSWRSLPKNAGLLRCGKSCRLRWINYLRSDLKRGNISAEEDLIIINLHATLGNRWSLIATHLPGRTDNEIKNYWNSHLSRKIQSETPVGHFSKPRAAGKKQRSCRTSRSAMKNNKPCSPTNMPNQMGLPSSGPPAPENDALSTTTTPCFGEERENGSFGLEREEFSLDDVMGFAEEREREDAMVKMSQEVKRESVAQDASKKKTINGDVEEGCFSHFTFSFGEDMKVGGLGLDWDTNWEWEETWGEDEKRLYCPWVNDYENEMNHDQQQNAIVSWLFS